MSSALDSIWNEVLNLMKVELTEVSFNTWLKTIEPISISSDKIILAAPNEFTKGILVGRYLNLIKNAVKHVTKEDFDIQFIIPGEEYSLNLGQSIVQENVENNQRAQLNPKYTFDTFVIGNSNRFAHAASLAVAEATCSSLQSPIYIWWCWFR